MASEIDICNLALVALGAEQIRDFTGANKRERVCETTYPHVRDMLLAGYDWSFARVIATLRETVGAEANEYGTGYDVPNDCLRPVDIVPLGKGQRWEQIGSSIYTAVPEPKLRYTKRETNTGLYTIAFVNALSLQLAAAIAPTIRQNDKYEARLEQRATAALMLAQEEDAGRGEDYRHPDNDPNNDSFVNPDLADSIRQGVNGYTST